jgi:hypothetical protein
MLSVHSNRPDVAELECVCSPHVLSLYSEQNNRFCPVYLPELAFVTWSAHFNCRKNTIATYERDKAYAQNQDCCYDRAGQQ